VGLYFHSHLSIGRNRAQKVQLSLVAVPENGSEVRVGNVEQVPGIGVRHALSVLQLAGRQCVPRCARMGGASHRPPPLTDFKGTCIARCVAKKLVPPERSLDSPSKRLALSSLYQFIPVNASSFKVALIMVFWPFHASYVKA
jgi:hypothetical protein